MRIKLSAAGRLTLPQSMWAALGCPRYFAIDVRCGEIVLTPAWPARGGDAVRTKLKGRGLAPRDVQRAVRWARRSRR